MAGDCTKIFQDQGDSWTCESRRGSRTACVANKTSHNNPEMPESSPDVIVNDWVVM